MPAARNTPDPSRARVDVQFGVGGNDVPDADSMPSEDQSVGLQALAGGPLLSTAIGGYGQAQQQRGPSRAANHIWNLTNQRPYADAGATGRAAVHFGGGRDHIERPFIFADGFNYGPSNLDDLWDHFNAHQLLDRLLDAGIDVILLGFDARHGHIQDNAGIAIDCIRLATAAREGNERLIVGGVSMGGIITRYALAVMENDGLDHQTETYLSYDSPHNGAWAPIVLQQLGYLFENDIPVEPGKNKPAELIRSPAAQQLLWAWVENGRYSGPVNTSSELRHKFLDELDRLGKFPSQPRKLGVANGAADGQPRDAVPGEVVFDWVKPDLLAAAQARVQPAYGERQEAGRMRRFIDSRASLTSDVPAFDSAPGGTLGAYAQIATPLGIELAPRHRQTCFVPTVSAIALVGDHLTWPVDLYTDVSKLPPEASHLDDYLCNPTNSEHSEVTPELADWIVDQLVP